MMAYNNRYLCGPSEYIEEPDATVSWHEMGRNQLVEKSLGEWLLMLDTDHQFAPDILDRLLFYRKKYNLRVVSAIYQYKFPPHAPVMNLWGPNNECIPIMDWDRKEDILEVGTVGAGCLLVDRSVFQEIQEHFKTAPFSIIQGLSEDYSFCRRCKDLGITVNIAPKVQCHHVIDNVLSLDDYKSDLGEAYRVQGGKGNILMMEEEVKN